MKNLKKSIVILLTFVIALALMPVQTNATKKVHLNKKKLSLKVGKTYTLKLKNAKSKKVKWSSSKKKVATVSKKGKVKAKKKGTCKITAKVGKKKYFCKITVKGKKSNSISIATVKPSFTLTPIITSTEPSSTPSVKTSTEPSITPSVEPTEEPTEEPTITPSAKPSEEPSITPSVKPTEEPTITPSVEPTEKPTIFEQNASRLNDFLVNNGRISTDITTNYDLNTYSAIETSYGLIKFSRISYGKIGTTTYRDYVYFYLASPTITVHYEITIGSKDYSGWANFNIASYAGEDLKFSGGQPMKANSQFLGGLEDWRSLLALNANLSYGDLGFLALSKMTSDEDNDDTNFGLFDEEDNLKYTWSKLINFGLIAMEDTKITSVSKYLSGKLIIPDTVTEIGNSAFSECGELTEINIPESVTNIGYYAFSECYLLSKINIPKSITDIPAGMFKCCSSLVDYEIPANTTSIGAYAFYGCGIKYADIPDGVTVIPDSAFSGSKIKTLILPVSISKIETNAFSYVGFNDPIQILYKGTQSQWKNINIHTFSFYNASISRTTYDYCE